MRDSEVDDYRRCFYGEFNSPPAMPWACRSCGRGYIARTEDGRCPMCKNGRLKRVPYASAESAMKVADDKLFPRGK